MEKKVNITSSGLFEICLIIDKNDFLCYELPAIYQVAK